jgi:hypothetical protein
MTDINSVPMFSLGRLCFTKDAMTDIVPEDAFSALVRHRHGDWGELDASDKQANDNALIYGGRLLSAYHDRKGVKFWIITEYHRNLTTVLLPADY